ncbi:DUF6340 family protein [Bacteroides sp.]|uniref:DUF6340 family protein n=1 Tax=Bacteroides sp. TaxID=29523 RepID=UPI002FCC2BD2
MAKHHFPLLLSLILTLGSCQTLEELSIDYMLPAEISFPAELKRVAVVNNTSSTPENTMLPEKEANKENEISRAVAYHNGDATAATTALAEAIAHENYFDEVVICDSALRAKDITPRESTLSKEEVQSLTQNLGVDFIIALENMQLKATKAIRYLPEWACFQGAIDVKAYPTVKVYLPGRKGPMVTINANDSIFWEELGTTETYVRSRMPNDNRVVEEASKFAGNIPLKYILPYWKTSKRYMYINGSVNMRDATIYVREESWDKASKLWKEAYEATKSEKKKMAAAHNIALYYEMQDSIETAETWAIKAQQLAHKVEKVDEVSRQGKGADSVPNYVMISLYLNELKERKAALSKLNMQMNRFNDDF